MLWTKPTTDFHGSSAISFNIFYSIPGSESSIAGALPSCLYIENDSLHGLASLDSHIRSRLTSPLSATSTNPRYLSYSYDTIANIATNHQDNRIILNRGLTVDKDSPNQIGVRCKNDATMYESLDSMQVVRNLSASQKYHKMDIFYTLTGETNFIITKFTL